jgi:tetratricopeptide (TPR) repeat protein
MADYGKLFSTAHLERGRYDEAIRAADEEMALDAFDPEPVMNRGRALVGLGRFVEGIADLERATRLDASSSGVDAWFLDDCYFEALRTWAVEIAQEDKARAMEILRRYLEFYPAGRHAGDLAKWQDHFDGVVKPWARETV